jgi:hypothetical protein
MSGWLSGSKCGSGTAKRFRRSSEAAVSLAAHSKAVSAISNAAHQAGATGMWGTRRRTPIAARAQRAALRFSRPGNPTSPRMRHVNMRRAVGGIVAGLVLVVASSLSACSSPSHTAPITTTTATPSRSTAAARPTCSAATVDVSAQLETQAVVYGTSPTHRPSLPGLLGQLLVTARYTCRLMGPPMITLLGAHGNPLPVKSRLQAAGCRLSCGNAPTGGVPLNAGRSAIVGLDWRPSYCAPDPGPGIQVRLELRDGTNKTATVRYADSSSGSVQVPGCAAAVAAGQLNVEPFSPLRGKPVPPGLAGFDTNCADSAYEPTTIALACGDNGVRATNLHFQGWIATTATATGIYVQNNCKPTCLGGHLIDYPATFVFSSPQRGVFTRVHVTFVDHRGPGGNPNLDRDL